MSYAINCFVQVKFKELFPFSISKNEILKMLSFTTQSMLLDIFADEDVNVFLSKT